MLALLYLLFTIFTGYVFVNLFTPYVFKPKNLYLHFTASTKPFPKLFIIFPASFTVGVIFSGWLFYIPAYLFRETNSPMLHGAIISFAVMLFITVMCFIFKRSYIRELRRLFADFIKALRQNVILMIFFCLVLVLIIWLMTLTFYAKDGNIRMGWSVVSDFSVHTALIRSFSYGKNFPTQFPHFPDGTIRYHFMFQFFTGVLEYLGLRIDLAFNLLSILALFDVTLLLYVLAVLITNKRAVGILTIVFFLFRSSFSGPRYLLENRPYQSFGQFIRLITGTQAFIGYSSDQEKWGLWNLNVYANQRHFALGISLVLFGIIAMLPLMKKMYYVYIYRPVSVRERIRQFLFTADAWLPENLIRAISLGFLFGAAAFFHGSAVIALLSMLAVMGLFSKHRLEFLIIALITYAMSSFQASFFAPGVELAKPQIVFGFIAPDHSPKGIALYIVILTGIVLAVALIGMLMRFKRFIVFFLIFLTPFVLTFTLSLTPDVTVNHKFLMISVMLLNIFAAYAVCVIMGSIPGKVIGVVLIAIMVSTGVIDAFTIQNLNGRDAQGNQLSVPIPEKSAFQDWILQNTQPDDVFLTTRDSVSEVFFAGRCEFYGWPYYAWSAGYDTNDRGVIFQEITRPTDAETCKRLVMENKISYIVITPGLYDEMDNFYADPDMLKTIFPTVYSDPVNQIYVLKTGYTP